MSAYKVKICTLLITAALLLTTCQKDDETNDPTNPTNGLTTAVFNSNIAYGSMTDQDGNVYKTVQIGNQTWMAENLRTTKYNDGTVINHVFRDNYQTISPGDSPFDDFGGCAPYNFTTDLGAIATYGMLYDYYAVVSGKLAPEGWRVANYNDYQTLIITLGDNISIGNKMMEEGFEHWPQNNQATNESGFTALPAGYFQSTTGFNRKGTQAMYWSLNNLNNGYYTRITLQTGMPSIELQEDMGRNELCSVRLIKI